MLDRLRISNLALISDIELVFTKGLNVLTGETGAGKSFIMKALDFICGEKLGCEMVRPHCEQAQVEAHFTLPGGEVLVRRDLQAKNGRSRLFLNGAPATHELVRTLLHTLLLHAGQHDQQRLARAENQLVMLDAFLNKPHYLKKLEQLVDLAHEAGARRKSLVDRVAQLTEKRDLIELHLAAIAKVNPQPGEEERLEQACEAIKAESARRALHKQAWQAIQGAGMTLPDMLLQLQRVLVRMADIDPTNEPCLNAISAAHAAVTDLEAGLNKSMHDAEAVDTDRIEARLYALAQLKRRLKKSMPEILAMRTELEAKLSFLDESALDIAKAERDEKRAIDDVRVFLTEFNAEREQCVNAFCTRLEQMLQGLGFNEQLRVIPEMHMQELLPGCFELRPRLLWAPNPGQAPQPLSRIASGGELSRFLLAITMMRVNADETTLVFDEVDAGIGGITLNRVGERLKGLSQERQVLLITHWPQLAALADTHFLVRKTVEGNETFTRCHCLDAAERQKELDRMAGVEDTAAASSCVSK